MPEEQKYLHISDAMGRDIDKGLAKDRDITDFLPDHVNQALWDAQHPGPVHAENLVPISKEEARRRTTFNGEEMPRFPATRRVIPAPFKRDRITGGSHGKAWTTIAAAGIVAGDIIPEVGLVTDREERIVYTTRTAVSEGLPWQSAVIALPGNTLPVPPEQAAEMVALGVVIVVLGAGGNARTYDPGAEVKAFRRISS